MAEAQGARIHELDAEVERLRAENQTLRHMHLLTPQEWEELERLRAALETIVECFAEQGTEGHHECLRIAREALASDKPR